MENYILVQNILEFDRVRIVYLRVLKKNAFKDNPIKLIKLIELSGYTLESSNSKTI